MNCCAPTVSKNPAKLLLAATRDELDDRCAQDPIKQNASPAEPAQARVQRSPAVTEIMPAPKMIYSLDPDLREPPPLGALNPVGRRTIPAAPTHAASAERATEQLLTTKTSALNNSSHVTISWCWPCRCPSSWPTRCPAVPGARGCIFPSRSAWADEDASELYELESRLVRIDDAGLRNKARGV